MALQNAFGDLALDASVIALKASLDSAIKAEDAPHVSGDNGIPALAIRSSSDTVTTDMDGDYTLLKVDEEGRLKVSSKPASYPDITGDITAVQATSGTPVVGGTVQGDVSRASNVMMFCTGTFAGMNCTFEGSLEASGDTNWFTIQAVRSNANTIETTTGALSAQPTYAWEASVNALKRVRVRCTARTSGTQSWRFVQGTYAMEPIPAAQISGTQPVSGSVTNIPSTSQGASTLHHAISAATTNATSVKASAGVINDITLSNSGATAAYFKLYNKASAPTVGTDTPVKTVLIPAGGTVSFGCGPFGIRCGPFGIRCATGIAYALTTGIAVADTGAVALSQIAVGISYT